MLAKLQKHLLLIKWLLLITLILNSMFLGMFIWTVKHSPKNQQLQICVDANNNIYASNADCKSIYNY